MSGRILTLQRQARELGRLRTGYTNGKRPVRSENWIITSHSERYVAAAAEAWGGSAEAWNPLGGGAQQWRVITGTATLDAILPAGDPLSQSYELWSGGGCVRRCDGFTELQADRPCICRAEHGDGFFDQPKGTVCSATTRLNVFLPDMPDVGVWRLETHSFYAAQEIAGAVDLIRSAVGSEAVIPIRLRIEQRQRKAGGQTKKFPVVVVELRGITTGQVLGASVMGGRELAAQAQREALGSTPAVPAAAPAAALPAAVEQPQVDVDNVRAAIAAVDDLDTLRSMWPDIAAAGLVGEAQARAKELAPPAPAAPVTGDANALWAEIQTKVPADWTPDQVEHDFLQFTNTPAEQAGATDMAAYLQHLAERNA